MHKKAFTLALGGLAIIGVLAGASYISGGSLLSSVLTTTPPVCQEQENDFALATQALEQYPERANIAERVTILTEAAKTAEVEEKKLADTITATVKKRTKYESLALLNRDLMQHKRLTTEVARLTNIRPRTAAVNSQLIVKKKELSAFNALVKKTTKSATTIDVLYKKYIAPLKELTLHTAALEKFASAQRALITVQEEQSAITQAESRLATAKEALEICRAKTPETPKEYVTYCFPTYQGSDGTIQKDCVDNISKIPQCYTKSTTTEIYNDETGELSSVNVVPDDNTKELFFCGNPETAYLDPANPLTGYPTIPGQGSNPSAEAAAPMGAENPNNPGKNPKGGEDNDVPHTCPSGIVVYDNAKCPEDAICGNYKCEYGEDKISCPIDCDSGWGTDAWEECWNGKVDEGEDCDDGNKEGNWNDSCQSCMFSCDSRAITDAAWHRVRPNLLVLRAGRPKSRAETVMQFVPFATDLKDKLKDDSRQCLYTNLPACWDGKIDTYDKNPEFPPEECDLGDNNGKPGFDCTSWCQRTFCGDGEVTWDEVCDTDAPGESEATCIDNCSSTVQRPL